MPDKELATTDPTQEFTITSKTLGEHTCFVGRDDVDLLGYRWHIRLRKQGRMYVVREVKRGGRRVLVQMHREIISRTCGRELNIHELIDHIDGNGLNNVRDNVRLATPMGNGQNRRGANRNSITGVRGVSPYKGRYRAQVKHNRVTKHYGAFDSIEEAEVAAMQARKDLGFLDGAQE